MTGWVSNYNYGGDLYLEYTAPPPRCLYCKKELECIIPSYYDCEAIGQCPECGKKYHVQAYQFEVEGDW